MVLHPETQLKIVCFFDLFVNINDVECRLNFVYLPFNKIVHNTFHASLLKPNVKDKFNREEGS